MRNTTKWYFLRWLTCWAQCAGGLAGIITLGMYDPWWSWRVDCWFLDCAEKELFDQSRKGDSDA